MTQENSATVQNAGNDGPADGSADEPATSFAQPIRVLLADDQSLIRTGFSMVINSQPDMTVVGEASDGDQAVTMTRATRPDVVLMDVRMPHEDGIAATAEILRLGLPTRVVILTTFDLDEYVMAAIHAGASGFLLKDASPEELLSSIRTVAEGNAIIAPSATKRLIARLVNEPLPSSLAAEIPANSVQKASGAASGQSSRPGAEALASLTVRERQVLMEVAQGLSNQEIADKLFISLPTVKTHVAHILAKTGSRDRVQAIVFAYKNGLIKTDSSTN